MIIETEFNSIGFFKVKDSGTEQQYSYQQYTLIYNISTTMVRVLYSSGGSSIYDVYLSKVDTIGELEIYLRKNGVIT